MSSRDELLGLARSVIDRAEPGEQVEAYASSQVETAVKTYDGAVEELSSAATRGVGVRVIRDGRQGYAWTAIVTPERLEEALAEARSNADVATPDDANGLADVQPVEEIEGLVDPGFGRVSVDEKIGLALDLERAARTGDDRIRGVETTEYHDVDSEEALVSTAGHELTGRRTDAYAFTWVMAGDDDETHTGMGLTLGNGPARLDIARAGREAVEAATRLLGAKKPRSRKTVVVFDPFVTAQFLGVLGGALSADAVLKRRSLFADRIGDTIASGDVSLIDDGRIPGAPGSAAWDGEGIPQQRTPLIQNGVLQGYLHNSWTARRMGGDQRSTGNAARAGFRSSPGLAPTNLFLEGPGGSAADVLGSVDSGVYIQDVMGLHSGADPISGRFSVGFVGLEISNGQLGQPIREAAASSTIVDILSGIRAVAEDRRFFPFGGSLGGATVVIDAMSISGV